MNADQADAAHLVEIAGNVKVATGDVMRVKGKKAAHRANLLPHSEAGLAAVAALLLLRHRDILCVHLLLCIRTRLFHNTAI